MSTVARQREHGGLPQWQYAIHERCRSTKGQRIPFDVSELEGTIPQRFEKVVRAVPDRPAIIGADQCLTYRELYATANQIAHAILSLQSDPDESPVALFLDDDVRLICAIFGVLQAGKGYVVLDGQNPPARLRQIVQEAGSRVVVVDERTVQGAEAIIGDYTQLVVYDQAMDSQLTDAPRCIVSPDRLAAIFFTSGTTGKPKGIIRNHQGILGPIRNHSEVAGISVEDRCSMLESPSVSASLSAIFGTLLYGASVVPLDRRTTHLTDLAAQIDQHKISVLSATASLFRRLAQSVEPALAFPHVRLLRLSGEAVYRSDVELYRRTFARVCILSTRWGQSETANNTMLLLDHNTVIEDEIVPVGFAVDGKEILIVGGDGEMVTTPQVEGEIVVRGRFMSAGYWKQGPATALKFLPDPSDNTLQLCLTGDWGWLRADGCLVLTGRRDQMVKIRGNRVEIRAVEAALLADPAVAEAAVLVVAGRSGDHQLAAYVVPKPATSISPSTLRHSLAKQLPSFMIPASFSILAALPTTTSGKIDRQSLPLPSLDRPDLDVLFVAPRTPIEKMLADIWSAVLKLEQVGVNDPFQDLGGNSLLAMQTVSLVVQELQTELPLSVFLSAATIADMALLVTTSQTSQIDSKEVDEWLAEIAAPIAESDPSVNGIV